MKLEDFTEKEQAEINEGLSSAESATKKPPIKY